MDQYLGELSYAGRRVREIGQASGFLTMAMEKRGGEVVAVEVPDEPRWDFGISFHADGKHELAVGVIGGAIEHIATARLARVCATAPLFDSVALRAPLGAGLREDVGAVSGWRVTPTSLQSTVPGYGRTGSSTLN